MKYIHRERNLFANRQTTQQTVVRDAISSLCLNKELHLIIDSDSIKTIFAAYRGNIKTVPELKNTVEDIFFDG